MTLCSCYCLLLLFLVPAAFAASTCHNTDPCVLDCTGCSPYEAVHDPYDCHGYYKCTEEGDYYALRFCCLPGDVFNSTLHACVPGDTCESCSLSCVYNCSGSCNNKISSFSDCHIYHECISGVPGPAVRCPTATPFFDGYECQADNTRCCHCHAFCYEPFDLVADPLDCRKYYICDSEAKPFTSAICPDKEYFDSTLKQCSANAPCITQCINVVGEDGCIDPYTCVSSGFMARCPSQCTPDYYHCEEATDAYPEVQSCDAGTVFHPYSHVCVTPDLCP